MTPSVETAVARIRGRNPVLNAFITTCLDDALLQAGRLDAEAPRSPLHRLPYSLKDQWNTAGIPTTAGSARYATRVTQESSPVHQVFTRAGAVLCGKTNMSDMGLSPEATSYVGGATRNPLDTTRTAGGSSGGAAAAVADGMVAFDWGSDIGGSIRLPAAFCGIYGLKLSSETWPIRGFFPELPGVLEWMCGQGPLTRDLATMRSVITQAAPLRIESRGQFSIQGVELLTPDHRGEWPTFADDVRPHLQRVLGEVRLNASLPATSRMRWLYGAVWASHFDDLFGSDTLSWRQGMQAVLSGALLRGRFGDRRLHPVTAELLLLIALGRYTLYRNKVHVMRQVSALRQQVEEIWARGQVLAMPVCMFSPPKLGWTNYNFDLLACTVLGNLVDATGLSIPFGRFASGLPRSIQLLGPPGSEDALLGAAEQLVEG
jgi:Asp-tRNA(Asn)/Glu-tRNA(Gln) amidotransferase A subunit family amidase